MKLLTLVVIVAGMSGLSVVYGQNKASVVESETLSVLDMSEVQLGYRCRGSWQKVMENLDILDSKGILGTPENLRQLPGNGKDDYKYCAELYNRSWKSIQVEMLKAKELAMKGKKEG